MRICVSLPVGVLYNSDRLFDYWDQRWNIQGVEFNLPGLFLPRRLFIFLSLSLPVTCNYLSRAAAAVWKIK